MMSKSWAGEYTAKWATSNYQASVNIDFSLSKIKKNRDNSLTTLVIETYVPHMNV